MSYNIGQYRRISSSNVNYQEDVSFKTAYIEDQVIDFGEDEYEIGGFYNPYIYLSDITLDSSLCYYLKFTVQELEDYVQKFILTLSKSDAAEDSEEQEVRTFTVPQGLGTYTIELIFQPNSAYNQIVFDLVRSIYDFDTTKTTTVTLKTGKTAPAYGRVMQMSDITLATVTNIISNSFLGTEVTALKKIGIQGPPGMMFCIDGEEMRIGRSGIYELYDDRISVSYLGFIVKDSEFTQDGKDFFILDYKY